MAASLIVQDQELSHQDAKWIMIACDPAALELLLLG